jgi:hypothetical protein
MLRRKDGIWSFVVRIGVTITFPLLVCPCELGSPRIWVVNRTTDAPPLYHDQGMVESGTQSLVVSNGVGIPVPPEATATNGTGRLGVSLPFYSMVEDLA